MTQRTQQRRRVARASARNAQRRDSARPTSGRIPTTYLDFAKRAFAPTIRFNELVVRNIEQATRFQYEVAGDLIQATLEQLNAAASTRISARLPRGRPKS